MQQDLIATIKALYADPQYNFLILSIFFPVALSAWKNVLAGHAHDRLDFWLDHGAALVIYACFGTFKLFVTATLSLDKWPVETSQDVFILLVCFLPMLIASTAIVARLYRPPENGRLRIWRFMKYFVGNGLGAGSVYMLSSIYALSPK